MSNSVNRCPACNGTGVIITSDAVTIPSPPLLAANYLVDVVAGRVAPNSDTVAESIKLLEHTFAEANR